MLRGYVSPAGACEAGTGCPGDWGSWNRRVSEGLSAWMGWCEEKCLGGEREQRDLERFSSIPPSRQRRSLGGIVGLSGMMKEVLPRSITHPSHPSVRLTAPATRADRWIAGGVEEEAFNALSIHLRAWMLLQRKATSVEKQSSLSAEKAWLLPGLLIVCMQREWDVSEDWISVCMRCGGTADWGKAPCWHS